MHRLALSRALPVSGSQRLHTLVRRTSESSRVLVHGDVNPKNIMIGPDGPVLLDAECAWFGERRPPVGSRPRRCKTSRP